MVIADRLKRKMASIGALAGWTLAVSALVGFGCSSSSSGATCGSGTTLVDGQCEVVDAGNGTVDAEVMMDAASQKDSAAPDAPLVDAPCITNAGDVVDCSHMCTATRPSDCHWGCGSDAGFFVVTTGNTLPYYIRTPHDFGGDTSCWTDCSEGQPYHYGIKVNALGVYPSGQIAKQIRIRVEPPFYIAPGSAGPTEQCYNGTPKTHCTTLYEAAGYFAIFVLPGTTPPFASQNIVIEKVPDGETPCP